MSHKKKVLPPQFLLFCKIQDRLPSGKTFPGEKSQSFAHSWSLSLPADQNDLSDNCSGAEVLTGLLHKAPDEFCNRKY